MSRKSPAPPRHPIIQPRKLPMIHQENHYIRLLVCLLIRSQLKQLMLRNVRLHHHDVSIVARLQHLRRYSLGRRLAQVIDIRLESQAHHCHRRLTPMLQLKPQHGVLHFLRTPKCLVIIRLTSRRDHTALHRKLRRDEVRVYRYAMTANSTTRL